MEENALKIVRSIAPEGVWIGRRSDFFKHLLTADNSTHYADYDYHGNLSILRGSSNYVFMTIGSQPRCVCCGEHFTNPREIKCDYCTHTVVCKDCGQNCFTQGYCRARAFQANRGQILYRRRKNTGYYGLYGKALRRGPEPG